MAGKSRSVPESMLTRALRALPLLLFTAITLQGLNLSGSVPAFERMLDNEEFDVAGNKLHIRNKFYGVGEVIDQTIGLFAVIFTQTISGCDPISYWQSFIFLTDYAGMYAVFLFECARGANRWTPMYL